MELHLSFAIFFFSCFSVCLVLCCVEFLLGGCLIAMLAGTVD